MLIVRHFFVLCLLILGCGAASAQVFPYFPIVGHPAYSCGQVNSVTDCTVAAGPPAITGIETLLLDTNLPGGGQPQTVLSTVDTLKTYINSGVLSTIINGSTSTTGFTNGQCLTSVSGVVVGASCGGVSTSLVVGSTSISGSCTTGFNLFNNSGILGCQSNGGGGSTGVPTIAAMQALTATANAIAVLTDPVRHGTFYFDATNHSVDVTNDPGFGITVPPNSDPTGASGAWIRQYNGAVDWAFWGADGDGITTDPWGIDTGQSTVVSGKINNVELFNFHTWALHQTSLGKGANVSPTCGQYNYNTIFNSSSSGGNWLIGIAPLTINGNHCVTIQNAEGAGTNALSLTASIVPAGGGTGTMTVTALAGRINIGQQVFGAGSVIAPIAPNTYVTAQLTSTAAGGELGLTGTYTVSVSQTVTIASGGAVFTSFTGTTNNGILTATNIHGPMFSGQLMLDQASVLASNTFLQKDLGGGTFSISGVQNISTPELMLLFSTATNPTQFPIFTQTSGTGYPINQTVIGSSTFTLTSSSDVAASGIHPGSWVMLGSLDNQFYGFPNNFQQFEYVQVQSINNPSPGDIVIPAFIKYQHMTTYPLPSASFNPGGNAQMFTLPNWDHDVVLSGLTVNAPPYHITGNVNAVALYGRYIHTIDWVGVGFAETNSYTIVHDNPNIKTPMETDKLNQSITFNNPIMPNVGFSFQSAGSANEMIINGGSFAGISGSTKKLRVTGSSITGNVQLQPLYGMATSTVFDSCELLGPPFYGNLIYGAALNDITGSSGFATYSNGTISLDITGFGSPFFAALWNAVPGMHVNLQALTSSSQAIFSNNIGAGIVLSVTWDGTKININTNLPFATLPTWSTGKIYMFHINELSFPNCTGNDVVRSSAAAAAAGKRDFEYNRAVFAGISGSSLTMPISAGCELKEVDVDVGTASQATTPTMVLTFINVNKSTFVVGSNIVISIDLTTVGKRKITQYPAMSGIPGTTEILGSDSVNGTGALPTGVVMGTNETSVAITVPASNRQAAYSEVIYKTDCGIVRTIVNPNQDQTGSPATVIPTQGKLP